MYRQKKDWMGQSNVWYAENNPEFIKNVKEYINKGSTKILNRKGSTRQLDILKRIEVEKTAIKIVSKHFSDLGYNIISVEKDNVGWDLVASKNKVNLKLEVKGLSGNSLLSELTPNEYKNLKSDKLFYRLCIVTNTLTEPLLKIFAYSFDNKEWTCKDGTILKFEEVLSAKIYC